MLYNLPSMLFRFRKNKKMLTAFKYSVDIKYLNVLRVSP